MSPDNRRRVLVVDDHALVALFFRVCLDKLPNCDVAVATSGEEALRLFEQRPFDVLVTDRMMPGMNGVMLAERVRRRYPRTAMIMATAFISDVLADPQGRDLFEHILIKPVEMDVMRARVLEALDGASRPKVGRQQCPEGAQAAVEGVWGEPNVKGGVPY